MYKDTKKNYRGEEKSTYIESVLMSTYILIWNKKIMTNNQEKNSSRKK